MATWRSAMSSRRPQRVRTCALVICGQTIYYYFRIWRRDGTLETLHTRLRERLRRTLGRATTPSAANIDSQSMKTSERGSPAKATDHWLRRREEGKGAQAAPARRYLRLRA